MRPTNPDSHHSCLTQPAASLPGQWFLPGFGPRLDVPASAHPHVSPSASETAEPGKGAASRQGAAPLLD